MKTNGTGVVRVFVVALTSEGYTRNWDLTCRRAIIVRLQDSRIPSGGDSLEI